MHFAYAQAPQSIPYQAVVRNTDGTVMSNTALTMTFKIHDGSATGTVVYEESHNISSNAQGLVALNVGGGTPITGTFSNINWGNGAKFLHVLMNAGNGVVDLGTQQMLSVPYALYAEKSNTTNLSFSLAGDTLYQGNGDYLIIPGISYANGNFTHNGGTLLPGNSTCGDADISITGCNGQDSIYFIDRYYSLVEIGGQCWFKENLSTNKYSNGDNIASPLTSSQTTGGYNSVGGSEKLYNWYTTVDSRNVCPTGWHVPSDCEWMYMQKMLGASPYLLENYRIDGVPDFNYYNDVAIKLRKELEFDDVIYAEDNVSGFSALPVGRKTYDGSNNSMSYKAFFWTSSSKKYDNYFKWSRVITLTNPELIRTYYDPNEGFSIRCIKD